MIIGHQNLPRILLEREQQESRFMAYINEAPMGIGTEDPWALTELAKAGGARPPSLVLLVLLPLGALVCDGAITGGPGHG